LATITRYYIQPAAHRAGINNEDRLANFPACVLDFNQVAGRGREGGLGAPAACLFQNDDGRIQAGLRSTETPAQAALADL